MVLRQGRVAAGSMLRIVECGRIVLDCSPTDVIRPQGLANLRRKWNQTPSLVQISNFGGLPDASADFQIRGCQNKNRLFVVFAGEESSEWPIPRETDRGCGRIASLSRRGWFQVRGWWVGPAGAGFLCGGFGQAVGRQVHFVFECRHPLPQQFTLAFLQLGRAD